MKLQRLLEEEPRGSKLLAYTLQQELPESFPHLITEVDITKEKNVDVMRAGSDSVYVLNLHGPLVSFYLDVSYQKNIGPNLEHTVRYRTSKDKPGDGSLLMLEFDIDRITAESVVSRLKSLTGDLIDMSRYNYLWFDKIAKHVETLGHQFFAKNIPKDNEVFTSQVIKKNERARCEVALVADSDDQFYIAFGKFGDINPKRISDLGELTDIMNEVFNEQPN